MNANGWQRRGLHGEFGASVLGFGTVLALGLFAESAGAAWADNRAHPSAREIAVVDATGEVGWPFGAEDIAGDGQGVFTAAEQARDVRTLYAATDMRRLWLRLYVSGPTAAATDVKAFVFVDSDRNQSTGGAATGASLDEALSSDPTGGGYDAVIAFSGDGTGIELYAWANVTRAYVAETLNPSEAISEVGRARDPILFGAAERGYFQVAIDFPLIGITRSCDANLFVRTINPTGAPGGVDQNVGGRRACIPEDRGENGVPDLVENARCSNDDQCPFDGICVAGRCVVAPACESDAACASGNVCSSEGWCVAAPGGSCTENASACGDLVCENARCVACTEASSSCALGYRCAPTGRCVSERGGGSSGDSELPTSLSPEEKVEGGAFHCAFSRARGSASALLLLALAGLSARRAAADPGTGRARRRR